MGGNASKEGDAPFETLDADQVRDVVAGFGTQFAGAADKMREAGIDGDYLAHASDDDLAVVFEECGLTKLQQSLLKQKLRKATRAPVVPPPLPPRPISPKDDAPTPPASPKANAPAPLRVRVTCPADGYAGKPITVQIPDGRKARAAIPDVAPGETFTILVPAAPPVHRVSVTCPPDKPPGSQLLVRVPSSGQTIRATVPQRLGPGRSFTVVAPAAPVATQYAVLPPPSVSLSSSASLDTSGAAAASGTAGIAKKFAKEVAKDYAWDQAKSCGKEVLASIVSSDSMADASGFLLGM